MELSEKIALRAHELFVLYGTRGVSMQDIALDLNISKKTIYQHYTNKEVLVELLIDKQIAQYVGNFNNLKEQTQNPIIELLYILRSTGNFYNKLSTAIVFDIQKNYPSAFQKLRYHRNEFIYNAIKSNLINGGEKNIYRTDFNVELLARFILESITILNDKQINQSCYGSNEINEEIPKYLVNGILKYRGGNFDNNYNIFSIDN